MNTTAISIGGSDAAAAIGLDPYRSRVQLWLEATGRIERKEAGEAALWGTLLEPVVRSEVERRAEVEILPAGELKAGYRTGHPDGLIDRDGIYEGKTANRWTHAWDEDGIPPAYVIQGSHYLALTERAYVLFGVLIGGQRLELRRVERDEKLIGLMLQLEEEFVGLVERDEPPAPDGSDSAAEMLRLLYPSAEPGKIIQATAADAELCAEIVKLKRAAKATEQQLAEREQTLKARLGEAEALWYEGHKLASWPTINGERKPTEGGPYSYRRLTVSDRG